MVSDDGNLSTAGLDSPVIASLLESGALAKTNLERARASAVATGDSVLETLMKLGLCSEISLSAARAQASGLEVVRLDDFPPEPLIPDLLKLDFTERSRVLPLSLTATEIRLGMVDPEDIELVELVEYRTDRKVERAVILQSELTNWMARQRETARPDAQTAGVSGSHSADIDRLMDLARGAPVIRWVDVVLEKAIRDSASDIHIEPGARGPDVRFRIDGLLRPIEASMDVSNEAVISRLKVLAGLDVAERRLPQDGRIRAEIMGRQIDIRIATMPGMRGEMAALRLLDRAGAQKDLEALGLSPDTLDRLRRALRNPDGVVLVTGPTGSGKTTTLYASLRHLMTPERKFISVEDPVEYHVDGVSQVQVRPDIGLTFSRILRSVLRHDPNVVMIGEIRDSETAMIAMEAALTGHLVLSTIHTNSAAATIVRLTEMGIEPYLIASTVRAVVAQRLVRRLCDACAVPLGPSGAASGARSSKGGHQGGGFRQAVGCNACGGSGYRGRTSVAEIMPVTPEIAAAISREETESVIERIALDQGMVPLKEAGMDLARRGVTSLEEILLHIGGET